MRVPSPHQLWRQSCEEFPAGSGRQQRRYYELMVEHGHLVKRGRPEDDQLPCGYLMRSSQKEKEKETL